MMTQWYLPAMNVTRDEPSASGKKVKVEVLDSGVSYVSALENVNRIDLTPAEEEREGGFSDVLFHDNSGHGTAMAGLIAADAPDGSLTGINPDADIYAVRILDENLQAPVSKAVEGIYWGIENDVDIINMSFGTEVNSEALHDAVKAAADAGILLVAAAGNNAGKGILYPAAYPEVIAVGATMSDGTILTGSATGSELELVAPGSQIISTGMVDGYTAGSGTSLATAEVTGIASLLLAQPGATADMVRGLLRATAKDVDGTGAGLVDYGYAKEHFAQYLAAYENNEVDETEFDNPAVPETYDTDGIVNGLWGSDKHKWLTDKAESCVPSGYITNVTYAAGIADDKAYHSKDYPQYNGLHGLGAYTVNLRALWEYARFIGKGQTPEVAKESVRNILSDEELEMLENVEKGQPYTTMNLINVCKKLLTTEKTVGSGAYPDENTRKKYLVIGFGCHMIGDIYAHRTLVPYYVFESPEVTHKNSTNSTSHDARLGMGDFENWEKLVNDHEDKFSVFPFPKLDEYSKGKVRVNDKYEDNPNFCRERFAAALSCTKEFLRGISSSRIIEPDPTIIQQEHVDEKGNVIHEYVLLCRYDRYMPYYIEKKEKN